MQQEQRYELLRSMMWDYSIPVADIDDVLTGKKKHAGHYTRQSLFVKMLETYPWFTIIRFFTIGEIKELLTPGAIKKLRMPSLQRKYEFVQKRLSRIISAAE